VHTESYVIQGRGGFRDNPNPPAFGATYWQVIVQHLLDVPKDANCRDDLATFLLELQDVNRCHPSTTVTLDGVSRTAGLTADDPSHHTLLPEECLNALCAVCFTVARNCRTYMYAKISCAQISYLNRLINLYAKGWLHLLHNVPLRPKHHYLLHYPWLITMSGPLIRVWTMRMDGKHSLFKRCARNCRNYIYITKTLSDIHQLSIYCLVYYYVIHLCHVETTFNYTVTWADSNGPRKDQNNWFHIVLILTSISWPSHWRVLNKYGRQRNFLLFKQYHCAQN